VSSRKRAWMIDGASALRFSSVEALLCGNPGGLCCDAIRTRWTSSRIMRGSKARRPRVLIAMLTILKSACLFSQLIAENT
jgi:hypothetical protein